MPVGRRIVLRSAEPASPVPLAVVPPGCSVTKGVSALRMLSPSSLVKETELEGGRVKRATDNVANPDTLLEGKGMASLERHYEGVFALLASPSEDVDVLEPSSFRHWVVRACQHTGHHAIDIVRIFLPAR